MATCEQCPSTHEPKFLLSYIEVPLFIRRVTYSKDICLCLQFIQNLINPYNRNYALTSFGLINGCYHDANVIHPNWFYPIKFFKPKF